MKELDRIHKECVYRLDKALTNLDKITFHLEIVKANDLAEYIAREIRHPLWLSLSDLEAVIKLEDEIND